MATPAYQRVGIWIIAVVMIIGTIFSFVVIILSNNNQKIDQKQQQLDTVAAQKQQVDANAAASKPLDGYATEAFDASKVTDLKVETLKDGDGTVAKADSTVTANYFGWTADGKIFDSSNKNGTTTPIDFSLAQVIKGWTQGLTGVKAGSVVKLTIPSALAYGDAAGGAAPAGPLVFIVDVKAVK